MACYYLVISSTHLSNGHYRSVKGVFRGPIRQSPGGQSPDFAEKEKDITKALEDLKANFYCELCDKQYHKHQEFDNHINSYDHAHKQRLKELKQREFARNVASKLWKDERKQERDLRRLHRLAQLRQQSDGGFCSAPKSWATANSIPKDHQKVKPSKKSFGSAALIHSPGLTGQSVLPGRHQPDPPLQRELSHSRRRLPHFSRDYNSRRVGISFCFSRKAQLKLESSASVFSDGMEEASDKDDLIQQRGRSNLQALWSRITSPGDTGLGCMDDAVQKDLTEQAAQGNRKICRGVEPLSTKDEQGRPLGNLLVSLERPSLDDRLRSVEKFEAHTEESNSPCNLRSDLYFNGQHREDSSPSSPVQKIKGFSQCPIVGGRVGESDKTQEEKSPKYVPGARYPLQKAYIVVEDDLDKDVSCIDVLSKDGETVLKWPADLLHYTKTEPYISYSCNPLYLDFKHSKNKSVSNNSTEDCCGNDGTKGGKMCEARLAFKNNFRATKPKKTKHHKTHRLETLVLDSVRESGSICMQNVNSQMKYRGGFESPKVEMLENKGMTAKRHRLGKRRRSLKEDTSNQSDTTQRSLKSIIHSLSNISNKKRKHQIRDTVVQKLQDNSSPTSEHYPVSDDHFRCQTGASGLRRGTITEAVNEKQRYCSSSDLNSDGEGTYSPWWRCLSSSGSSRGSSLKRSSSHSGIYTSRSSDSSCSDVSYHLTRHNKDRFNLRSYKRRKYSRISLQKGGYHNLRREVRHCWRQRAFKECTLRSRGGTNTLDWSRGGVNLQGQRQNQIGTFVIDHVQPKANSDTSEDERSRLLKQNKLLIKPLSFVNTKKERLLSVSSEPTVPNICGIPESENDKSLIKKKVSTALSLPLIGKFPSIKRNIKNGIASKLKGNLKQEPKGNTVRNTVVTVCNKEFPWQDPADKGSEYISHNKEQQNKCIDEDHSRLLSGTCIVSIYSAEHDKTVMPKYCQELSPSESTFSSSTYYTGESVTKERFEKPLKCSSPPLAEQPITFSPDEIDKYRQLQLQAQEHVQQQLLGEQSKVMPEAPSEPLGLETAYDFFPFQPQCPFVSFLQHPTLATLGSSMSPAPHPAPPPLPLPLPPQHPLQPHFAPVPLSPIAPALFPSDPAVMLAGHPLHLIPLASLRQPHLSLNPIVHGSLLPALLAPRPVAAAASTLHLHPLLQPLFPRQSLQPQTGPSS